jgi:hypothetical protein
MSQPTTTRPEEVTMSTTHRYLVKQSRATGHWNAYYSEPMVPTIVGPGVSQSSAAEVIATLEHYIEVGFIDARPITVVA